MKDQDKDEKKPKVPQIPKFGQSGFNPAWQMSRFEGSKIKGLQNLRTPKRKGKRGDR